MTMHSTETVMRPAAAALEAWFPVPGAAVWDRRREALAVEQAEIRGDIARMGSELDPDLLDEPTDHVTVLLARAEEIRLALVLAGRVAR